MFSPSPSSNRVRVFVMELYDINIFVALLSFALVTASFSFNLGVA